MDWGIVAVAAIGTFGVLSGQYVSRKGQKEDRAQKIVVDTATNEHIAFEELKSTVVIQRESLDRARAEVRRIEDEYREYRHRADDEMRRLRSDLAAVTMIVRDEIAKEAAHTAHDIEAREPRTPRQIEAHDARVHPPVPRKQSNPPTVSGNERSISDPGPDF